MRAALVTVAILALVGVGPTAARQDDGLGDGDDAQQPTSPPPLSIEQLLLSPADTLDIVLPGDGDATPVRDVRVQVRAPIRTVDALATAGTADAGAIVFDQVIAIDEDDPYVERVLGSTLPDDVRVLRVRIEQPDGTPGLPIASPGLYTITLTARTDDDTESIPVTDAVLVHGGGEDAPVLQVYGDLTGGVDGNADVGRAARLVSFSDRLVVDAETLDALRGTTAGAAVLDTLRGRVANSDLELVSHPSPAAELGTIADDPVLAALATQAITAAPDAVIAAADLAEDTSVIPGWRAEEPPPAEAMEVLEASGIQIVITPADETGPRGLTRIAADAPVPVLRVDPDLPATLSAPSALPPGVPTAARIAEVAWLLAGNSTAVLVDDIPEASLLAAVGAGRLDPGDPSGSPSSQGAGVPIVAAPPREIDPTVPLAELSAAARRYEGLLSLIPDASNRDALRDRLLAVAAVGLDESERRDRLVGVHAALDDLRGALRLTGARTLNLTSESGTLPIAVVNDATIPLRVEIVARSDRLRFPAGTVGSVIEPGETRIDLPVEALASGSVPVAIEIRVPGTDTVLDARRLNVRSTSVPGVGIMIAAGALSVLGLWWFRTWRATRTDRDRDDPGDHGGGHDGGDDEDDGRDRDDGAVLTVDP